MTNYSLRARMMILILAPTVLIGLLLSIFFVVHRYNDLQRQLEDAGASIIEPLAVSSEYGMNLQNRESIGQLISVLHRRHSERAIRRTSQRLPTQKIPKICWGMWRLNWISSRSGYSNTKRFLSPA